mgnify:CR=1 FL=1
MEVRLIEMYLSTRANKQGQDKTLTGKKNQGILGFLYLINYSTDKIKDFWCQSCQKRASDDAMYHAGLAVVVGRVRLGRRGTDGGGLLERRA